MRRARGLKPYEAFLHAVTILDRHAGAVIDDSDLNARIRAAYRAHLHASALGRVLERVLD